MRRLRDIEPALDCGLLMVRSCLHVSHSLQDKLYLWRMDNGNGIGNEDVIFVAIPDDLVAGSFWLMSLWVWGVICDNDSSLSVGGMWR